MPGEDARTPSRTSLELAHLVERAADLSHTIRDFRDRHGFAGALNPEDFDYPTELGIETGCVQRRAV